ncbi:MAG: hypothetical protein ACM3X9_04745 [Bacillota bacterium]
MVCLHCGFNLESGQTICPNCGEDPRVTVLPPEERENYSGLTIEQAENGNSYKESEGTTSSRRVFVHNISLNPGKGLFTSILLGAIFLVIFIIALPVALLLAALFFLIWSLTGFRLRGRR